MPFGGDLGGLKKPLLDGVPILHEKGQIRGIVRPTEKNCKSLLSTCSKKWMMASAPLLQPTLHCYRLAGVTLTFPHENSSPCDAASRQNSLTTFYILCGTDCLKGPQWKKQKIIHSISGTGDCEET